MLIDYQLGQASVILRVKLRNTSSPSGAGLKGLTGASANLVISTIADNEATATAYTSAGATIDTITTLGTYAAPTTGHCRFAEVDPTNHAGVYEVQLDNARLAVAGAKSLLVSFSGATGLAECDACIPLRTVNPYSAGFGLVLDQGALDGITLITAGGGPNQPAINLRQGVAWATIDVLGLLQGEDGVTSPKTLSTAHPYTGTTLETFVVDQDGNRSNLQILAQPS